MNIFKKNIYDLKINEIEEANENYVKYYFNMNGIMERLYYKRIRNTENSIFYYYTNSNNIRECEAYLYTMNGTKMAELYYVNNKIHGKYIKYYSNGNKRSVEEFEYGKSINNIYTFDKNNKFMNIYVPSTQDVDSYI